MGDGSVSAEATVVASKIRSVDRELDVLERERVESIVRGMKAPNGAAAIVQLGQDSSDLRHAQLLEERAELVAQLKVLLGDS